MQLKQLKEEASVLSNKFADLDADQSLKLKDLPMFKKGLKFFTDLNVQIIQAPS